MARPHSPHRTYRVNVTITAILAALVPVRWREFFYRTFSPYVVELGCFDLRKRVFHWVTRPLADLRVEVQAAVDREIARHYQPGRERDGALIKLIFNRVNAITRANQPPAERVPIPDTLEVASAFSVFFPAALREAIEERWRELGFNSLSAYITSLIRYDLMLGGPHLYFDGEDMDPELLVELNRKTLNEFQTRRRRKILCDYLIEEVAGRELTEEERTARMTELCDELVVNALRAERTRKGRLVPA